MAMFNSKKPHMYGLNEYSRSSATALQYVSNRPYFIFPKK
jgi:hypothetical protein